MDRFVGSVRAPRGNPDAHYLLGDYYQGRGRHREAIEEFNKAIRIDPRFVRAYNGIAVSLDQMGEHDRALEYYQAALQIQPDLDYLYNNMGYSFLLQERYEEAAAAFEKASALSGGKISRIKTTWPLPEAPSGKAIPPRCPTTRSTRPSSSITAANLRLKSGSFEEARGHYQKALTLDPDLRGARKGTEVATLLAEVKRSLDGEGTVVVDGQDRLAIIGRDGVEISNGNGMRHMAKDVGAFLKKQGFNVVRLTNADHFQYAKASVYYRGDAEFTALRVKGAIPGITQMKKVGGFDRDNVQVKVLVGQGPGR